MHSSRSHTALCVCVVSLLVCDATNAQGNASVTIACDELYVGQTRHVKITIPNHGEHDMIVDRAFVCCGNPVPAIDKKLIKPGQSAELTQEVTRKTPGHFRITAGVLLKQPENTRLDFLIEGDAKQPVIAFVAWDSMPLRKVDYSQKEFRLDTVHHSGRDLAIRLASDPEVFDLKDALVSIESEYLVLDKASIEFRKRVDHRDRTTSDQVGHANELKVERVTGPSSTTREFISDKSPLPDSLDTLGFKLRVPRNRSFPKGELLDNVVLTLRDGLKCYLPLAFRAVGDVYGESSVLAFGNIPSSRRAEKDYRIHFANGTRRWSTVAWKADGTLADAISISVQDGTDEEGIPLRIQVDGASIPPDARGFLSSRVVFSDGTSDQDVIPLIVYAYK